MMSKALELMCTLETEEQQQLLRDIVGDTQAPDGFDSWKDAAIDERLKRVEIENQLRELEAEIQPLREMKLEIELETQRRTRLDNIVDLLFNQVVSGTRDQHNSKCRHPEKYWWWNGANIIDTQYNDYAGCFDITVESYVGGGDTETFSMRIPREWLDAEDPTALIDKWSYEHTQERLKKEKAASLKKAQYDLERAQAQVQALTKVVQDRH